MAQMVKPQRSRKSNGPRSHTLARRQVIADLLKTPKSKRESFDFTDESGNVIESVGTGFLLDPASLNVEGARNLSHNSTRTMVYNVAKDAGVTVKVLDWGGQWAVILP